MTVKLILATMLIVVLAAMPVEAGVDGLGAPDTVDIVVTVAPYAAGGQMQVQMEQMDRQLKGQEIQDDKTNDQAEIKFKYDELSAKMEMKEAELTVDAISNQKAEESTSAQGSGGNGANAPRET